MSINDTDKLLVNRSNSSYYVEQKDLMASLQDTDLMLVNRSNTSYKITGADLKASVVPPASIVEPIIIAPPDGAGIGGDVTYTPKTSAIANIATVDGGVSTITLTANKPEVNGNGINEWYSGTYLGWEGNASAYSTPVAVFNISPTISANKLIINLGHGSQGGFSGKWWGYSINGGTILKGGNNDQLAGISGAPGNPNASTVLLTQDNISSIEFYNILNGPTDRGQISIGLWTDANGVPITPSTDFSNTQLTFADANTYNADTGDDMGQPISDTFTAGQLVTGVKAGSDTAVGMLTADASGNTMTVMPLGSPDFKLASAAELNEWYAVAYGDKEDRFVAVAKTGTNRVMYSSDGINWTSGAGLTATDCRCVTYGNGIYVAGMYDFANAPAGSSGIYSLDGITWVAFNAYNGPLQSAEAVAFGTPSTGVNSGTPMFVLVSNNGYSAYSTDGINWTNNLGLDPFKAISPRGLACGAGKFVMVGQAGGKRAAHSTDGINWTVISTADDTAYWQAITYGNGKFVAVGGGSTQAMYSTDGISWTGVSIPGTNQWNDVSYAAGVFTAVGQGSSFYYMYSSDGISWTPSPNPNISWNGVAFGGSKWVAVASVGTNRVMYSPAFGGAFVDGMEVVNTTTVTKTAPSADDLEFVGSTPTADPIGSIGVWGDATWEVSTDSAFTSPMVGTKIITAGSNQTLLPAERGAIVLAADTDYWARLKYLSTDPALVSPTSDAVHFKTAVMPGGWFTASAPVSSWNAVTYGNGKFVAIASTATHRVMYSDDGTNWTATTSPILSEWQSVTYGGGKFVAVARDGATRVMYSTDGISWTAGTAPASLWRTVTYGMGTFVAIAGDNSNDTMYSTDGINWTSGTTGESGTSWYAATYGGDKFVAVGYSGTNRVIYSTDGISWTVAAPAEVNSWSAVTYGGDKFVAVSDGGSNRVMYSTDGITWTSAAQAETNLFAGVTYGAGVFVAVAFTGTNRIMYSSNGINWTAVLAPEANPWNAVTYGGGQFVAVANSGTNEVMWSYTGKNASPGAYYDTATNKAVTGDGLVNRYGIDPTTDNLKRLGVAELTEQPTYAVAGYQADGDKYQPIEDLTGDVEKLKERNKQLRQYMAADMIAEAQALIAQWAAEDAGIEEGDTPTE